MELLLSTSMKTMQGLGHGNTMTVILGLMEK